MGAPIVISSVAETVLVTLPALGVARVPVKAEATVQLGQTGGGPFGGIITFRLYRNPGGSEVQVGGDFSEDFSRTLSPQVRTLHWVDPTPGNTPIYELRAISATTDTTADPPTTLTATI